METMGLSKVLAGSSVFLGCLMLAWLFFYGPTYVRGDSIRTLGPEKDPKVGQKLDLSFNIPEGALLMALNGCGCSDKEEAALQVVPLRNNLVVSGPEDGVFNITQLRTRYPYIRFLTCSAEDVRQLNVYFSPRKYWLRSGQLVACQKEPTVGM